MSNRRIVICLLALSLAPPGWSAGTEGPLPAMRAELQRSMRELRLEQLARPYFVSYRIDDTDTVFANGSFGSLATSSRARHRFLFVEVRVGSYELDNTNYASLRRRPSGILRSFGGRSVMLLDDDPMEIRRTIWLATDDAYKQALENLASKRAALQNRQQVEELADFSREEPTVTTDEAPEVRLDLGQAETLVRRLSALFREMPAVQTGFVTYNEGVTRTWYVNSEGSSFTRSRAQARLFVRIEGQAEDGLPLIDSYAAYGAGRRDMPADEELERTVQGMGARLGRLRQATLVERYNGPVLFEGLAAASILALGFVPKLVASRVPVADDARRAARMADDPDSLRDRIGARILPRFLYLTDDPTRTELDGQKLPVHYKVDDEAVEARPTKIIERGLLRTLLANRTPVPGIDRSTGHSRGGWILPSNLELRGDGALTSDALREELLLEVRDRDLEYGIIVRRVEDSNPRLPIAITEAYRVYTDGREELMRNGQMSQLTLRAFKDILAVSDDRVLYTTRLSVRSNSGQFGRGVISIATPSLLFEDLSITRPTGDIPFPPVAAHPFFEPPETEH